MGVLTFVIFSAAAAAVASRVAASSPVFSRLRYESRGVRYVNATVGGGSA